MTAFTIAVKRLRSRRHAGGAPKAKRPVLWLALGVLLWVLASLLCFPAEVGAQAEVVFSDDFEAGLDQWNLTGHPDWYSGIPRNGSYSARLSQKEVLERTISTEGYASIVVSFYLGADSLDKASENVQALWYDGATYVVLKQIDDRDPEEDGQLHYFEYALPQTASNNLRFGLAFRINAGGNDFGYVDDVVVRGTPVPHLLEVTAGCSPDTVASGGSTACSAGYTDSRGHGVATWSWDDGGAGGSFAPSAGVQNPSYTAPENTSDSDLVVTLTVTVTCDGPSPLSESDAVTLTVQPVAHTLEVSAECSPDTVASGGSTDCSAGYTDSRGHGVATWSWDDGGAGGSFSPSAGVQSPSYTAPENLSDSDLVVTLTVTVTCDGPSPLSESASVVLRVVGSGGCTATFPDVPCDHWAHDSVEACVGSDIVNGYPNGNYYPLISISRAQMAVYVSRAIAGGDEYVPTGPAEATFPDIPTGSWAYKYIEYAHANSIVFGYPNGRYRPEREVDRGQMAIFIARSIVVPYGDAGLADYVPPESPTFPDVTRAPNDPYAVCYTHVEYLAAQGIAHGYPDGRYHPERIVTRDVMAVYIARAFELLSG